MKTPVISEDDPLDRHRLELLYVKALFLESRHRECILACRKVLQQHQDDDGDDDDGDDDDQQHRHPLRTAFMRFYLALSHDELARAMHSLSKTKIPAFDQASHLYDEAISTLPSAEECIAYLENEPEDDFENETDDEDDDFEDDVIADDHASPSELAPSSRHDSVRSSQTAEKARPWSSMHSAPMSPPTRIRHSSPRIRSPPVSVSGATPSEFDDLESHDSFNEIMTPNRVPPGKLERDYSSMSLIAPAQKQLSQGGLMRPIRMGSPTKPYHLPNRPPNGLVVQHRTQLPRLDTSPTITAPPVRKQLLTASEQNSPVDDLESPVSPLGSEGESVMSELATISPISLETPMTWRPHIVSARDRELQSLHRRCQGHIHALRSQLESHQSLLQTAKLKTRAVQLDHEMAQQSAAHMKAGRAPIGESPLKKSHLQQLQTPFPASPADARRAAKHSRILAGRARDWRRERFDPTRYARLADSALAEL